MPAPCCLPATPGLLPPAITFTYLSHGRAVEPAAIFSALIVVVITVVLIVCIPPFTATGHLLYHRLTPRHTTGGYHFLPLTGVTVAIGVSTTYRLFYYHLHILPACHRRWRYTPSCCHTTVTYTVTYLLR